MTTYKPQSGMSAGAEPDADAGGELQRRARRLCLGAEPHADAVPCDLHVRQALSQLSLVEVRTDHTDTVTGAETTPDPGRL